MSEILEGLFYYLFSCFRRICMFYGVFALCLLSSYYIMGSPPSIDLLLNGAGILGRTVAVYCVILSVYVTTKRHNQDV